MINSQKFSQLVNPALTALSVRGFEELEIQYPRFCELVTSSKPYEEDHEFAGLGSVRLKPEGRPFEYDEPIQGLSKRITPNTFALGVHITMEAKQDGNANFLQKLPGMLSRSMAMQMESVAVQPLNNAFSNTRFADVNGQPLISSAHVLAGGGTLSNQVPTNQGLDETSWNDLEILARLRTDDRGFPQHAKIREVLIPPQLMVYARKLANNEKQLGSANNDANTARGMRYFVVDRLTSPIAWFALAEGPKALRFHTRMKPVTKMSDDDKTYGSNQSIVARFTADFFDWRNIYGSTGAGV